MKQHLTDFGWRSTHTLALGLLFCSAAVAQTLDNETISGEYSIANGQAINVVNNLTLDNATIDLAGVLNFLDVNTLAGTGLINMDHSGDLLINYSVSSPGSPQQLTIQSGIEIIGNRNNESGNPRIGPTLSYGNDRLINYGIIAAEGDPANLNSDMTVSVNNLENYGTFVAREGGVFRASWDTGWVNNGTFRAESGGIFNLSGTFDPSNLGTLVAEPGGVFSINATVNNQGKTWTIDQSTGSMQLENSTINGGTIVGNDGAKLFSTSSGRSLYTLNLNDGVTFDIDVDIQGFYADVNVAGGLTVNREFVFNGDDLTFNGSQTISGAGNLYVRDLMYFDGTLTIDPGMTLTGGGGSYISTTGSNLRNYGTIADLGTSSSSTNLATLYNAGTIRSDLRTVRLPDQALNEGFLLASGKGLLRADNMFQNGKVTAINGGRVVINGGTNTAKGQIEAVMGGQLWLLGSIVNDGSITVQSGMLLWEDPVITGNDVSITDGTVVFVDHRTSDALPTAGLTRVRSGWGVGFGSVIDNTARSIELTSDPLTQWTMFGGTIIGGTIESPDATPLIVTEASQFTNPLAVLDGVVVNAPVNVLRNTRLSLTNGTALNGDVYIDQAAIQYFHPVALADLPTFTGQNGRLSLINSLSLGGQLWHVPTALSELAIGPRYSQGSPIQPVVLSGGTIVGNSQQTLILKGGSSTSSTAEVVLRDVTLGIDTKLEDLYTSVLLDGTVHMQGSKMMIPGGSGSGDRLYRHGEVIVASGGELTGTGTIAFSGGYSTRIGGFFTEASTLVINPGITVVGGSDGIGWLGSSTAATQNLGTLEVSAASSSAPGLRVLGVSLINEGTLKVESGGWIDVDGKAKLGGTLEFSLAEGFVFDDQTLLTIMQADFVEDGFTDFQGVTEINGRPIVIDYNTNDVVLYLAREGDLNADMVVDDADLAMVLTSFGQSVESGDWSSGDLVADGLIDEQDLRAVLLQYGTPKPPSTQIPEPGTLAGLAMLVVLTRRKRRMFA